MAHRTAYHVLRSVARVQPGDELVVLGAGGGVGLAAVQLGAALGAHGHRRRVVGREARRGSVIRCHTRRSTTAPATCARRCGRPLPDGADAVIDPVGGDLSEPALRSLRCGGRFVTVGYASGEIPRIPLNLVLVKGVHVLGFQFQDVAPDEFARNEAELGEMLVTGRAAPHIGAVFRSPKLRARCGTWPTETPSARC